MKKLNQIPIQIVSILAIFASGCAVSQPAATEQMNETVTGEELYVVCTFCHGDSLQGNDRRDGPSLAGLDAWYLESQMRNFRDGIRGTHPEDIPGQVMHFSTGMLRNDFTIESIAEYISELEPGKPMANNAVGERPYVWDSPYAGIDPAVSGDAEAGGQTYSSICSACHGVDGVGNEALGSANLVYLSEIYIARQLKYFRDGVRGTHPSDMRGMQMSAMSKLLTTDQAIADVAAYIRSLRP
jgi:cytochrome c oxidase subunit 2